MNDNISDKDKKDWHKLINSTEKLPNKDFIHKKTGNILNVTVNFIAEVITCIRDKDKKIVSGDPEKIKKIYDTWIFSRDTTSANPNWQLVNILT